jgi:hypothetical protein
VEEMALVMQRAITIDTDADDIGSDTVRRLKEENSSLRHLLQICNSIEGDFHDQVDNVEK